MCCRRLSSSGMSRRGSNGELDVNVPLHREGSSARFARAGSSTGSGLSCLGADPANNTTVAYRGPFGHLGEDPDYDAAAVTIGASCSKYLCVWPLFGLIITGRWPRPQRHRRVLRPIPVCR